MQHMLDVLKTAVNGSNEFLNIFSILLIRKQCPCNMSFLIVSTGGLSAGKPWDCLECHADIPFQAEMKLFYSHLKNFANTY